MKIHLKRYPVQGARRTLNRFAWLPVELESGQGIWLERYKELQTYYYDRGGEHGWVAVRRFQ